MCGLYIHIPFCKKKCKYCDFNSYCGLEDLHEAYFACLEKEVAETAKNGVIFDTVYIGGGTPTAPDNRYLVNLIKNIKNKTDDAEITVECNPGTVSFDDLKNLKHSGANRLSIGLQSTDDKELEFLGRIHTLSQFEECFNNARKAGFDNISIDIMFGLPNQTLETFKKTLQKAAEYESEHISCYCLKIEKGTPFASMNLNLPDDDQTADMYDYCVEFLKNQGYERYEISNFSKNGRISKHNTKYWLLEDYIGIGAGAHSFYENKRYSKICSVKKYINEILSGKDAIETTEEVTESEKMSEFVFLGLRMSKGISEGKFKELFSKDIFDVYKTPLEKYLKMGVIKKEKGRIFIEPRFLYVCNNILSDFI